MKKTLSAMVKKELGKVEGNSIAFVLAGMGETLQVSSEILKLFINIKKKKCIYVTLNQPYKHLEEVFKKEGVKTDNIRFVDLVSKSSGSAQRTENAIMIPGADDLTDLAISIEELLSKGEKGSFVYFDSVSTMEIYNSEKAVQKFIHFLTTKMRAFNAGGFLFSVKSEEDKGLIAMISQFCDKVIEVD